MRRLPLRANFAHAHAAKCENAKRTGQAMLHLASRVISRREKYQMMSYEKILESVFPSREMRNLKFYTCPAASPFLQDAYRRRVIPVYPRAYTYIHTCALYASWSRKPVGRTRNEVKKENV